MNSLPTLKSIYEKQKQLANQQALEQERLARELASKQQQQLANQLKEQRYDYQQLKQIANRQINQRGRNLLNQLSNRGLATSGLMQLGDVQNRLATGQTLSELAQENRRVQEAGMQARENISSNLQNALMQANIQRDTSLLNADLTNYELRQGEQDKALQTLLSLVEVLGAEGMDDDIKNVIAQAYQAYLDGDSEALRNLIGGSDGNTDDGNTGGGLLDTLRNSSHPSLNYTFKISTSAFPSSSAGKFGQIVKFKLPNGEIKTFKGVYAYNEALDYVKNMYKDFPNYDKISIEYNNSGKSRIVFKVNNKKFKTYNEANEFIKEHRIS